MAVVTIETMDDAEADMIKDMMESLDFRFETVAGGCMVQTTLSAINQRSAISTAKTPTLTTAGLTK